MAITANKVPGVRAAVAWSEEIARLARQHNNANVLAIGPAQPVLRPCAHSLWITRTMRARSQNRLRRATSNRACWCVARARAWRLRPIRFPVCAQRSHGLKRLHDWHDNTTTRTCSPLALRNLFCDLARIVCGLPGLCAQGRRTGCAGPRRTGPVGVWLGHGHGDYGQ